MFLILLNEYIFFQIVVDDYAQSFRDVLSFEKSNPKDPKVLKEFSEAVHKVRERHTNTVIIMAEAVMEMKNNAQRHGQSNGTKQPKYMENIQYFLDRLYISRISTRMLINQHTALFTELDKVNFDRIIKKIAFRKVREVREVKEVRDILHSSQN